MHRGIPLVRQDDVQGCRRILAFFFQPFDQQRLFLSAVRIAQYLAAQLCKPRRGSVGQVLGEVEPALDADHDLVICDVGVRRRCRAFVLGYEDASFGLAAGNGVYFRAQESRRSTDVSAVVAGPTSILFEAIVEGRDAVCRFHSVGLEKAVEDPERNLKTSQSCDEHCRCLSECRRFREQKCKLT
ncbi:hypothetical protein VTK56DRAFT_6028 [Thermocarpiscus australiensis]